MEESRWPLHYSCSKESNHYKASYDDRQGRSFSQLISLFALVGGRRIRSLATSASSLHRQSLSRRILKVGFGRQELNETIGDPQGSGAMAFRSVASMQQRFRDVRMITWSLPPASGYRIEPRMPGGDAAAWALRLICWPIS